MMRAALVAVLAAACSKEEGGAAVAGSQARDAVVAAWKQAGLEVSALTSATVAVGTDCQIGTVAGIDVLLCMYASDENAKGARDAGLEWVGDATGISHAKGTLLIVAADRKKRDPNGRTLNKLSKLASK